MCGGIEYQEHKVYFPQSDARLPVRLRDGNVTWVTWGRREKEAVGKFPNGGWARLNSIKSGKWKPWHPRPVLIVANQFMEKDHDHQWLCRIKRFSSKSFIDFIEEELTRIDKNCLMRQSRVFTYHDFCSAKIITPHG